MATSRLTEEEVHSACAKIAAQGERPTSLVLLERLGKGSLTTITKYLNSWNATDEAQTIKADNLPAIVKLPPELLKEGDDLLKKIWHIAKNLTDAEIESQREALKQAELANQIKVEEAYKFSEVQSLKIESLEDMLEEFKAKLTEEQHNHAQVIARLNEAEKVNVGLEKDNDRFKHEFEALKKQLSILETTIKTEQQEKQALQQKHDEAIKQKEAEIKDKSTELSNRVVEFEKLKTHHETTIAELKTLKTELKTSHKITTDAEKLVANLEGQLAVYKILDKSKGKEKTSQ